MRDKERVLVQEKKNYNRAIEIFNELLKDKKTKPIYKQMPDLHCSDMRMQVGTNYYNIELKSRSTSIYTYGEQPISCKKYCNLVKDTKPNETLLYLAIIEGGDWYMWNLSELDWRDVRMDNMTSLKQQYNIGGSYYVTEPYLFLPLSTATISRNDLVDDQLNSIFATKE